MIGVADHGRGIVGKNARHRREVADVPIDNAEQRDDGGLVGVNWECTAKDRPKAVCMWKIGPRTQVSLLRGFALYRDTRGVHLLDMN